MRERNSILFLARRMIVMAKISLRYLDIRFSKDGQGLKWCPLAVSFVPAFELPDNESDIYRMRLNIVGGMHHDVAGIDVGVGINIVSRSMYGIQAT